MASLDPTRYRWQQSDSNDIAMILHTGLLYRKVALKSVKSVPSSWDKTDFYRERIL